METAKEFVKPVQTWHHNDVTDVIDVALVSLLLTV